MGRLIGGILRHEAIPSTIGDAAGTRTDVICIAPAVCQGEADMRLPPIDLSRENTFGELTYENGGDYGPIGGDYLAFMLVHVGSLTLEADDSVLQLEAGQCALSLTRDRYMTSAAPDTLTHI